MSKLAAILSLMFLLAFCTKAIAQTDTSKYWEIPLGKLTEVELSAASKFLQKSTEVTSTVKVITSEQIKLRGYSTLEEALSDLPGFQFRNIQGFNSYVFLRGLPNQNNYIIVMIDGVPVNEINSGGFYGGAQYNLNHIKQIEIIYGPASVLYGTNAISGVINLVTESAEKNQGLELNTSYGSFNRFNFDGSYNQFDKTKNIGFTVSGMFKHSDKMKLGGEAGDNNWTGSMENFETDESFDVKIKLKEFVLACNYQNKQSSRTTNYKSVGTAYSDYGSHWNIRFANIYALHNHNFSETVSTSSKIYFRDATVLGNSVSYVLKSDTANPGDQVGNYRPNIISGGEFHINLALFKKIKLISGVCVEFEKVSNGFGVSHSNSQFMLPTYPEKPKQEENILTSIFSQASTNIFNKLEIIGGIRYDYSTLYKSVITPRAAAVYTIKKLVLKAIYNDAYRAPRNWDYTFGFGNQQLKPEQMQAFEVAALYKPIKTLNTGLSVYRNSLFNALTKNTQLNILENRSKTNAYGFEFNFEFCYQKLNAWGNYTHNFSVDQFHKRIPEISQHTANAGVEYKVSTNLYWETRLNYIGSRLNNNPAVEVIDDALIFNTSLLYKNLGNFDIRVGINNITNQKYYHPSNTTVSRYRQPGRTFGVQISFHPWAKNE